MADLINLRRAHKAKARREAGETAAAQRALFGRTLTERQAEARSKARENDFLDQHRLTDNPAAEPDPQRDPS